ncbi:MAG: hypothetical protein V7678_12865 [Brevundimonas sp.]
MPHQNTQSSTATAQNAATGPYAPNDQAREQHRSVRPDPDRYAAPDVADSSLAPPAAGEVADYQDEGEPLDGAEVHMGGNHTTRPVRTEAQSGQGPKTRAANRAAVKGA